VSTSNGHDDSYGDRTTEFERHRDRLFGIAYRMTGSVADAEDLVQDAWLRWSRVTDEVAEPGAYLARTITNLALTRLTSAAVQRERYVGPWLPEPLVTAPDVADEVADEVERAESVSLAMLVVLESLSPLERAAFILREVFGYSHREVAAALDRSETSVRQLARRARSHVEARRPRYPSSTAEQQRLTEEFLTACAGGDLDQLMRLLAPDVTVWTDGGGKRRAALRPLHGADKVARWFIGVSRDYTDIAAHGALVNGQPGAVLTVGGTLDTVVAAEFDDQGRIAALRLIRNPDKLRHIHPR
jgi:RNA polymerase sigma-70 factor (ECF subfamily)